MCAGEVQRRGLQGPAPEGLRWSALDWEARAGLGHPSVRGKGRGAEGTKVGREAKGPESHHAGGNNAAIALGGLGQGAENGGGTGEL